MVTTMPWRLAEGIDDVMLYEQPIRPISRGEMQQPDNARCGNPPCPEVARKVRKVDPVAAEGRRLGRPSRQHQ
jgi:hypothetical protein